MGSIERRIEDLERLYNLTPSGASEEQEHHQAERRMEMHALMRDVEASAAREAESGDPRRHLALVELAEHIKRSHGRAS